MKLTWCQTPENQTTGATMFEFWHRIFIVIFWTNSLAGSTHLAQKSFFIFSFFAMMTAGKMTPKFIGSMGHMKSSFLKSVV
jgi:hypothetical protein